MLCCRIRDTKDQRCMWYEALEKTKNRKRGGLKEKNGDGQLSIAANATVSTINHSASINSRVRMHTEVQVEHDMDWKVSDRIMEVTHSSLSSQQQSKGLHHGRCLSAEEGWAAADD